MILLLAAISHLFAAQDAESLQARLKLIQLQVKRLRFELMLSAQRCDFIVHLCLGPL